jgi:hypothetical protein
VSEARRADRLHTVRAARFVDRLAHIGDEAVGIALSGILPPRRLLRLPRRFVELLRSRR